MGGGGTDDFFSSTMAWTAMPVLLAAVFGCARLCLGAAARLFGAEAPAEEAAAATSSQPVALSQPQKAGSIVGAKTTKKSILMRGAGGASFRSNICQNGFLEAPTSSPPGLRAPIPVQAHTQI